MRRFILFAISSILLFSMFQVLSGWILTLMYTPNMSDAWSKNAGLPQEVVFGGSDFMPTLLVAIISATIAFFMSKRGVFFNYWCNR
ncbi:hypothetical protein [Thermaerobacillus caldiproteolyticus]|uniref:Uncharacterized protein n=1 Tax=Thermaerobacillus caldiproteolyticus TaxID=247480 RepID=A0A7V9Z9D9_9BACL|nr:hypothetical protein [Anoxybacillus caldiproteolyticus]MBA2876500.1 hypothetical protein [Anoxybacillus caldiproteolyticus]